MRRIAKECLVHSYGPDNPVRLQVASGEVFIAETHDRFAGWEQSSGQPDLSDPLLMGVTGAIAVQGAQPGDIVAVDIVEIRLRDGFGFVNAIPGKGAFASLVTRFETRRVPFDADGAVFGGIRVPLRPMIGRIGAAPADRSVPSVSPGPHGGNLDVREIGAGSTVYLPVSVPGALISVGDVHAAQGDGESMISGVETAADLVLRCRLLDGSLSRSLALQSPMVRTPTHLLTIASAPTLDEASHMALWAMHGLLRSRLRMDPVEAGMLISLTVDVGVGQIVNPLVTAKAAIPRSILDLE